MSEAEISQVSDSGGRRGRARTSVLAFVALVVFCTTLTGASIAASEVVQAETGDAPGAGSALGYQLPNNGRQAPPAGQEVLAASIELTVVSLANLNNRLFFPSMQIDLGPFFTNPTEIEGGHIGPQDVGGRIQSNWGGYFREYSNPNHRYTPFFNQGPAVPDENRITPPRLYTPDPGVELQVGHFDPGTYTQVNTRSQSHFDWKVGRRYKLSVYRGDQKDGYWTWHGWIDDLTAGQSYYIGALYSTRSYIAGFGAWVETGVSGPDPLSYEVVFSNPRATSANGTVHRLTPGWGGASGAPNSAVYAPDRSSFERSATVHHVNNRPVPANAYIKADASDTRWRPPSTPPPPPTPPPPTTPPPAPPNPSPGSGVQLIGDGSGLCLTAQGASDVVQSPCNGDSRQSWSIQSGGGGTLRLVNDGSGKCLDVDANRAAHGTALLHWPCHGQAAQQWRVRSSGQTISLYHPSTGNCVDVPYGSRASGVKLHMWECHGGANQNWAPAD